MRTIFWKRQWDKKMNTNHNNIDLKSIQKEKTIHMQKYLLQSPTNPTTATFSLSSQKGEKGVPFPTPWQWHEMVFFCPFCARDKNLLSYGLQSYCFL